MRLGSETRPLGHAGASTAMRAMTGVATPADWLRFYREHGYAPFPFAAGAEGEADSESSTDSEQSHTDDTQSDNTETDDVAKLKARAKSATERGNRLAAERDTLTKERDTLKGENDTLRKGGDKALGTLTKERDEWKAKFEALTGSLRTERLAGRAAEEAAKLGAIEPSAVAGLVNAADVEWDDDHAPKDVAAVVAKVKERYPKLFSTGRGNGGNRDERSPENVTPGLGRLNLAYAKK